MKTKLAFVFLLLSVFVSGHAQEYAFKVLVNKGKNEVKSASGWQAIKVGTSLTSVDELRVSENAYVGLVHVSGKPLEVKQAGKYKVVDLASQVGEGSSVLNKYTDFILSSNTAKKNNLAATGAVHRGIKVVQLYLPRTHSQVIYNDEIIISWDTQLAAGPYTVRFNSLFEDELDKIITTENFVKVDLSDSKFTNEDNITVTVEPKSDVKMSSEKYTLRRASKADKERIKTLLNEIAEQVQEPTALNMLVLAGFYEQNGLLIDASTAYQKAIKLAPDVPYFSDEYRNFLSRNALLPDKN